MLSCILSVSVAAILARAFLGRRRTPKVSPVPLSLSLSFSLFPAYPRSFTYSVKNGSRYLACCVLQTAPKTLGPVPFFFSVAQSRWVVIAWSWGEAVMAPFRLEWKAVKRLRSKTRCLLRGVSRWSLLILKTLAAVWIAAHSGGWGPGGQKTGMTVQVVGKLSAIPLRAYLFDDTKKQLIPFSAVGEDFPIALRLTSSRTSQLKLTTGSKRSTSIFDYSDLGYRLQTATSIFWQNYGMR